MFQDHFEFYSDAPSNELIENSTIEKDSALKAERCFLLPTMVVIAILLAIFVGNTYYNEYLTRQAKEEIHGKTDKILKEWLETQRKGQTGYEYWRDSSLVQKVRFYALQDYEIVDRCGLHYTVRIHSSTKGGTPIVCLWKIEIINGEIWEVKQAEEN